MSVKNEFYIYLKNKPKWVKGLSFDKQTRDVQQFYLWELKKIREGITVGGIKFHPWSYWHINHWHIFQDIEHEDGSTERVNSRPLLRDNEYFINENVLRADTKPKKGLLLFGTRRFSKSATIASWSAWNSQIKYGGEASINAIIGGNQEDLDSITSYIDHGLEYLHPMFKLNRISRDWGKGAVFGKKLKNNETEIFSKISVTNLNMGGKKSNQKTAGPTPVSWVCDEIGKFDFKKSWEAAKPSFDTGKGSWRISPWLLGTSGNIETVADAMSLVNNPEIHNLLVMDWSLIERKNPNPTWTRKNWGIFVPGQMSLAVQKVKSNLSEYLEIDNEELKNISIEVTPWEEANKKLLTELEELRKKDITSYYNRRMFYPLDTDDCFLQDGYNPFPSSEALVHKSHLLETGDYGKNVELYRNPVSNIIEYNLSDKELPKFPHEGGNIDSPFILFEEPPEPEERGICQLYCGGLDHYKHDTSSGDSLGAFYIFKRRQNIFDLFQNSIVACYVARPNTMDKFNHNVELLMKLYGAEVLQENADISFQQYLMRRNEVDIWLMNGEKLAQKQINSRAFQNNKYGLTPNVKNLQYIFQLVVDYCWEILEEGEDENGVKITRYGITRIKDIMLLEEIIAYKKGQNHDRILAFGYALAWAQYLDDINVLPKRNKSNTDDFERERKRLLNKYKSNSFYSNRRTGFYG